MNIAGVSAFPACGCCSSCSSSVGEFRFVATVVVAIGNGVVVAACVGVVLCASSVVLVGRIYGFAGATGVFA